jgi:hypothetical protein
VRCSKFGPSPGWPCSRLLRLSIPVPIPTPAWLPACPACDLLPALHRRRVRVRFACGSGHFCWEPFPRCH